MTSPRTSKMRGLLGASSDVGGYVPSKADRIVAKGRAIFSDEQWKSLAETLSLSEREFQILQCVFDDDTESRIAEQLAISAHTVHSHLARLYRKLGVRSRCECLIRTFHQYILMQSSIDRGKHSD